VEKWGIYKKRLEENNLEVINMAFKIETTCDRPPNEDCFGRMCTECEYCRPLNKEEKACRLENLIKQIKKKCAKLQKELNSLRGK